MKDEKLISYITFKIRRICNALMKILDYFKLLHGQMNWLIMKEKLLVYLQIPKRMTKKNNMLSLEGRDKNYKIGLIDASYPVVMTN